MNIYPSLTLILLQLIPFLLTLFALNSIIFKPMLNYLNERENASSGAGDKARAIEAEIAANVSDIEAKIQAAQKDASQLRSTAREKLVRQYNEVVHQSRKEADQQVKEAAIKIEAEQTAARQEIKAQSKEIALQIACQTLGRDLAAG